MLAKVRFKMAKLLSDRHCRTKSTNGKVRTRTLFYDYSLQYLYEIEFMGSKSLMTCSCCYTVCYCTVYLLMASCTRTRTRITIPYMSIFDFRCDVEFCDADYT